MLADFERLIWRAVWASRCDALLAEKNLISINVVV
jgi:hypothetical protein